MHHHFATVRHRVMRFQQNVQKEILYTTKASVMNSTVKYSLFSSWQVNYSKTKLTAKYLRQIHGINKVRAKVRFLELRETLLMLNVSNSRTNNSTIQF